MGLETVALAVGVLGTVGSFVSANQQAKAQEKAQEAQSNIADIQRVEALRERTRRARVARAEVLQAGENQGVAGSSGVLGGAASIGSQLFQGAGLQNRIGEQARIASAANIEAGQAAARGSLFDTVGSLGTTFYGDFRDRGRVGGTTPSTPSSGTTAQQIRDQLSGP